MINTVSNEVTNCKYSEFKAAIIRGPRALDKPGYRIKYENIWQITLLFKFLCVSCTKIKISIKQLMFFQSLMSEMLYYFLVYTFRNR